MDGPSDIRQTGRRYRAGARHTAGVGTEASERRSRAGFRRQDGARWRAGYGRESDAGGAFRGRTQGSAGEVAQGWEGEKGGKRPQRTTNNNSRPVPPACACPCPFLPPPIGGPAPRDKKTPPKKTDQ